MPSAYYTEFVYKAQGLEQILSKFRAAAKEIEATSKSMGKINFIVNDASLKQAATSAQMLNRELQKLGSLNIGGKISGDFVRLETVVSNLEKSITSLTANMSKIGASSASFSKISTSANSAAASINKITTSTNAATSSSTKLTSSLSTIGASISRSAAAFTGFASSAVKSFASATSSALKFASTMTGAVTGSIERAAAAMLGLGAAGARAGGSALAGAMAMPKNAAMWAAPMATSLMQTLLSPEVLIGLGGGYSVYSAANLEKIASMAAAKSGATNKIDADAIKQIVISVANSFGGKSVYTPNQVAQGELAYAAMGGQITDRATTEGVMKNALNFAQAVTMDVAPAMELLYSQALNWKGFEAMQGPGAAKAVGEVADGLTVLANQTRLNADDLAESLKAVTPVAKAFGWNMEQTYASVGTLSNLGRNPEEAGTDVRRMLLRFTPSYNALQQQEADQLGLLPKGQDLTALNQALKDIGLTYEGMYSKLKEGNLGDFAKTIMDAMKAKGMSEVEQDAYLKTQLGIQGATPFRIMASDAGKQQNADLLAKLYDKEGKAAAGAKIATDNLDGAVRRLLSHIVANANELGAKYLPGLTKWVDKLNEELIPSLEKLGGAISSGDWSTVGTMFDSFMDQAGNWAESLSESFKNALSGDTVGGALDWIQERINNIDWSQAGRIFDNILTGLESAFTTAATWLWDKLNGLPWGEIESKVGTALESAGNWLKNKIDGIDWSSVGTKLGAVLEYAGGLLVKLLQAIPWSSIATALSNAIVGAIRGINWSSAFAGMISVAQSIGSIIYSSIAGSGLGTFFSQLAYDFEGSIRSTVASIRAEVSLLPAMVGEGLLNVGKGMAGIPQGASASTNPIGTSSYKNQVLKTPDNEYYFADSQGKTYQVTAANDSDALKLVKNQFGVSTRVDRTTKTGSQIVQKSTSSTEGGTGGSMQLPAASKSSFIPSGKYDFATGEEISKGSPIYINKKNPSTIFGEESFKKNVQTMDIPNYELGVASIGYKSKEQQVQNATNLVNKMNALSEMQSKGLTVLDQKSKTSSISLGKSTSKPGTVQTQGLLDSILKYTPWGGNDNVANQILQSEEHRKAFPGQQNQEVTINKDSLKDIGNQVGMGLADKLNPTAGRTLAHTEEEMNKPHLNPGGETSTYAQEQIDIAKKTRETEQGQLEYVRKSSESLANLAQNKDYAGLEKWFDNYNKEHPSGGLPDKNAADFERADKLGQLPNYLEQLMSMLNPNERPKDPGVDKKIEDNTKKTADGVTKTADGVNKISSSTNGKDAVSNAIQNVLPLLNKQAEESTAATNAAASSLDNYGGAVRIGIDELGRQVAVIGKVRQQSWGEEQGKRWADQGELSSTSKTALSVGNTVIPAKVNVDDSQYKTFKSDAEKGVKKQVTPAVNLSGYYSAKAEMMSPVTKNVYVNTIYSSLSYGTSRPGVPAGTPTKTINFKTQKYHSGGITPGHANQEYPIMVRGQEKITPLNQDGGNNNKAIEIHIHAEGATFVGNRGITQLAEEISRVSNDKILYTLQ